MITTTCIFVTVLIAGLFQLWRYSEHNELQKTLMKILVIWVVFFCGLIAKMLWFDNFDFEQPNMLYFWNIVTGFIMFLIFMLYPAKAIHPSVLTARHILLTLVPSVILFVVYLIWHNVNDIPFDKVFTSWEDVTAAENRVTVLMRLGMLMGFYVYYFAFFYNIYKLIPIYQKHIENTHGDTEHNILWLKTFIFSMAAIGAVYLLNMYCINPLNYGIYMFVGVVAFCIIIDNAMYYKPFDKPETFNVKWSVRKGWYVEDDVENSGTEISLTSRDEELFEELDDWMKRAKPYTNHEFNSNKIKDHFPEFTYNCLNHVLAENNLTFQSYVRDLRINEAIRLMNDNSKNLSIKEISYTVGFTHYSSFSRAFSSVTGVAPQNYNK